MEINKQAGVIIQEGKSLDFGNPIHVALGTLSIYFMIVPIGFLDFCIWFYQFLYFGSRKIPKIKRSDFVVMDRGKLKRLNFIEKVDCVYCEYVNGVLAFAKAVAAQTEIYSCAIKHKFSAPGQDHQNEFYERENFE